MYIHSYADFEVMDPCLCGTQIGLSIWRDLPPPHTTFGECTLEFFLQSKHIGSLFLTAVLVIDALCPMLLYVSYIPSYHAKELIIEHLRWSLSVFYSTVITDLDWESIAEEDK